MLGEEFNSRDSGGPGKIGILATVKALRAIAICLGYSLLRTYNFPVTLYTYYCIAGSAAGFLVIQQPWKGRKALQSTQLVVYALLLLLNLVCWNLGLKYYGPVRTILACDHLDVPLAVLITFLFPWISGKTVNADKIKGLVLLFIAYTLLFLVNSVTPDVSDVDSNSLVPRYYDFLGIVSVPESKAGGLFLVLAVIFNLLRKNLGKKITSESKRLYALGTCIATAILTPFAAFSYFTATTEASLFSSNFFTFLWIVLFAIVAEFYVEGRSHSHRSLNQRVSVPVGLAVSFVVASILEYVWELKTTYFLVSFISLVLIILGMQIVLQKKGSDKDLASYSTTPATGILGFLSILSLRQILANRESRRIFAFLCANLGFMFVEMVYGMLTNSLGLISDAFHMLFDCTALVIGLYAAVIANWDANKMFSYGYGRVQVLSGFVNGIFLVFIAILILKESVTRFVYPQEIKTERLLEVSVLGLLVNLVGVVAFHDLHDHSDDGGHSHSHGHSHEHSHAHSHKDDKKDANLHGVYLHILADTLGSVGVIVSTLCIQWRGWVIADPICSFCISLMITVSVIPLLKGSAITLLQTTPDGFDHKLEKLLKEVKKMEGVVGYSHPHFWKHFKDVVIGTLHVHINETADQQKILHEITMLFKKKGVKDLTVEITRQTL